MQLRSATLLAIATAALAACATPPPTLRVPHFNANDPRVTTAGFVGETLRISQRHGSTDYTLMAFAVGDTLTLGAMVKGEFRGEVRWLVDDKHLSFAMDTVQVRRETSVAVTGGDSTDAGDAETVTGQGAEFRGTSWVNVELPVSLWMTTPGTALRLEFAADAADLVSLPARDGVYAAQLEPAPR